MASQALYRKWRSQTFQELIGQEAVVRTLKNAAQTGHIAHAYLFCGPRGTGKTSAARLLAKTVNCQNPQNGEPCNTCPNCREITENRSLDVIEIDAASNRGIDEIRELRERVMIRPATGKFKLYVLDEAHMLTEPAFNALLKTLEEPPPYVIFVLATTDAERIPTTIVSRCQPFYFKRHTFRNTVSHLQYVAGQEGVTLENGAAELMARAAGGGMRDALGLLDQAMAALGETVTQVGVQQMLGLADPRLVRELVEHIAFGRGADGLHLINHLAEVGADLRQLSAQVADYWRAMMLARAGADIVAVLDRSPEDAAEIRQLAESFALDELSACARLFSQNDVGARAITIPQLMVELAFIDCLHLHRQRAGAAPAAPNNASGSAARLPQRPAPPVSPAPAQASTISVPPSASAQIIREAARHVRREEPPMLTAAPADEVVILDLDAAPEPAPAQVAAPPEAVVQRAAASAAAVESLASGAFADDDEPAAAPPTAAGQPGLTLEIAISQWEMVKKACKTKTQRLAALLNDAYPVAVTSADGCEVFIQVAFDFHYKKLLEPESRAVVEWALKEILQVSCRCRFLQKDDPIPVSVTAPAVASDQPGAARPREPVPPAMPAPASDDPPRPTNGAAPIRKASEGLPAQNGHGASSGAGGVAQASAPPANALEAKVRHDPVVEEIVKTYRAKLVEWKPLGE